MTTIIHTGLKIRLDPNNVQASHLLGCAGASRVAYNFALALINERQELWATQRQEGMDAKVRAKTLSAIDIQRIWHARKPEQYPWHGEYPSKLYLYAIRRAVKAHSDWLSSKTGYPHFKSKTRTPSAFTVCESIYLRPGSLQLPRIGQLHVVFPDRKQSQLRRLIRKGRARIVSATVSRDSCGTWWASLQVERQVSYAPENVVGTDMTERVIGVNVGVKSLAVAADSAGELIIHHPGLALTKRRITTLKRAQRTVSRKDRQWSHAEGLDHIRRSPSRRRKKARQRVARQHRRLRNIRIDDLHQLTSQLAKLNAPIAIEDLNVSGMSRRARGNGRAAKAGLNRRIRNASFSELRRQLQYKLPSDRLIIVDRYYPSSKTCSNCGRENQALTLRDRSWRCDACGMTHDRDINAAMNLAAWAQRHLSQDKDLIQAGDRESHGPFMGDDLQAHQGGDNPVERSIGLVVGQGQLTVRTEHGKDLSVSDVPVQGTVAVA